MRRGRISGARSQILAVALTVCVIGSASVIGAVNARAVDGPPTLTVTPSTDLADGQVVQVTGSGIPVTDRLYVIECAGNEVGAEALGCDGVTSSSTEAALQSVAVGADGTLNASASLRRRIVVDGGSPTLPPRDEDCTTGCSLKLFRVTGVAIIDWTFIASTPISFVPVQLNISIGPDVTRDAMTNLVMIPVTVTCNTPTIVGLQGFVVLPSESDSLQEIAEPCTPTDQVRMFFEAPATRPVPLGDGSVSLCEITPPDPIDGSDCVSLGGPFTTSAVHIVDFATVREEVLAELAIPANTAFRAEFVDALRAALDQAPTFRAQFVAALRAH